MAVAEVKLGSWPRTLMLYGKVDALTRTTLNAALSADVRKVSVIKGDRVHKDSCCWSWTTVTTGWISPSGKPRWSRRRRPSQSELSAHRGTSRPCPGKNGCCRWCSPRCRGCRTDQEEAPPPSPTWIPPGRRWPARRLRYRASRRRCAPTRADAGTGGTPGAESVPPWKRRSCNSNAPGSRPPMRGGSPAVQVSVGQRVNPGNPLLDLFEEDSLVFRALIPERYLPDVQEAHRDGRALRVTGQLEGKALEGELVSLVPRSRLAEAAWTGCFA